METRETLKTCGRILSEKKLVWGHSGNISARLDASHFIITPAGSDLGKLQDDDLVVCRIDDDQWLGEKRPSIETSLHRGIYRTCPLATAVIHSQPFYATLVACSDLPVRTDLFPEAMAYLGNVERIPYSHAGSAELARATAAKAQSSRVLLLHNHGAVCWGASLDEALLKIETLEFLSRILVVSGAAAIDLYYLGNSVMRDFLDHLRQLSPGA